MSEGQSRETAEPSVSKAFREEDACARDLRWIRLRTVECVLDMLSTASRPMDEWDADVLLPHHNGYSLWLIGHENFDASGNLMGTAPLSAEQIVDRIEKRENARGSRGSSESGVDPAPRGAHASGEQKSAPLVTGRPRHGTPASASSRALTQPTLSAPTSSSSPDSSGGGV